MSRWRIFKSRDEVCAWVFIVAGLLMVLISMCAGCSPKVVTQTVTRSDTVYIARRVVERDTVREVQRILESRRDSVVPVMDSVGKVIAYDRWHVIERQVEAKADAIRLRAEADTVSRTHGEAIERVNPPPDTKGKAAGWVFVILLLAMLWVMAFGPPWRKK